MPLSPVTAALMSTGNAGYRSKLSATPLSSATGSIDSITIAHQLGVVPDEVRYTLRSITTGGTSGSTPGLVCTSMNASQVVLTLPSAALTLNISADIVCEVTNSLVR